MGRIDLYYELSITVQKYTVVANTLAFAADDT